MSRYGWSSWGSPYSSFGASSNGVPNITDEDFSYITSEDLQDAHPSSRYGHAPSHLRAHAAAPPAPEDDVLLIKNNGVTYPAHFPAYAIGDGKLRVSDVRSRIALELELSDSRVRRAKVFYKGRQLKEPAAPVRDYGVKNNSELRVVLPDGPGQDSSSASDEEMVVVADDSRAGGGAAVASSADGTKKRKKRRSKKSKAPKPQSDTGSALDSASTLSMSATGQGSDMGSSSAASAAVVKLNEINEHFMKELYPMVTDYIANTPTEQKKRVDEHRKISETIMQHTLLKLDGVDTNGEVDARNRRKELVRKVQAALKDLDDAKAAA